MQLSNIVSNKKHNSFLLFSVLFCWFFSIMISYTAVGSSDTLAVVLKAIITGIGLWCGFGLLKRRPEVLWFAVALCLYAVCGSFFWLYESLLQPYINGQHISFSFYDLLGILYVVCGSIVIWFLLHERTRRYIQRN